MSELPEMRALLALMARLRDPQQGCPWDRAQDFASIAPYTIEEAYELAAAIGEGDPARIRDELGDLLFQVVFHARLAEERGWFDFAAVAAGIREKLERRHPHVFGTASSADAAALSRDWEAGKRAERATRGHTGILADVPLALPALTRAAKLGRRAAQVGFDWPAADGARRKLDEELGEFDAAATAAASDPGQRAALEDELGDVLFSVVNIARLHKMDPEGALRAANAKFERRFAAMESLARDEGLDLQRLTPEAWEILWQRAKQRLAAGFSAGSGAQGDAAPGMATKAGKAGILGVVAAIAALVFHAPPARAMPRLHAPPASFSAGPEERALAGDEALNRIIDSVQRRYNARVVKVTETSIGGRRVYELRLLSEQRVWTVRVDAESGQELPRSE